jgi:hypothetical protein
METPEHGGAPGTFYRLNLDLVREAYPDSDASWQRQRARETLSALNDAGLGPEFPKSPEDLASLVEDFDLRRAAWRSTVFLPSGRGVEVAMVDDLIGIRNGGDSSGPILIFTTQEWRSFSKGLMNNEFSDAFSRSEPSRGEELLNWVPNGTDRQELAVRVNQRLEEGN